MTLRAGGQVGHRPNHDDSVDGAGSSSLPNSASFLRPSFSFAKGLLCLLPSPSSARATHGSRNCCAERITSSSTTWISDLNSLLQAEAAQPDIVLIDVRGQHRLPSALPLLKRQHPATNVILIASTLDPALMLEAMRAGVNECIAEPLAQADVSAAVNRLLGSARWPPRGAVFAFVGAKGGVGTTTMAVNVATSLAKLSAGRALLIDLHLAYGDAAVFLGAESAVLGRRRARKPAPARRGVLQQPRRADGFGPRPARVRRSPDRRSRRLRAPRFGRGVRRDPVSLHRARRAAVRFDGARLARSGVHDRGRGQPGARDRPQRRPDGGGAAVQRTARRRS